MVKKTIGLLCLSFSVWAQPTPSDSIAIRRIYTEALSNSQTYKWLQQLTKQIGPRLSGSPGAQKAIDLSKNLMQKQGFDRVYLQEVMVPHWVRGTPETAHIQIGQKRVTIPIAAAGSSVATPPAGLEAPVVEVSSFKELQLLGSARVKGKIVFFNRLMNPTHINLIDAYMEVVSI